MSGKRRLLNKVCIGVDCGVTFRPYRTKQKYHSLECAYNSKKRTKVCICVICGAEIICRPSENVKTCSDDCNSKHKSRLASGMNNPCFGLLAESHPAFGHKNPGRPGFHHSDETKQVMRQKWLERTDGGLNLQNMKFKQGSYASIKNGETSHFHSSYELRRMKFLDCNPRVLTWTKRHGIQIPYVHNGTSHVYIPDFLIIEITGLKILEEVKGFVADEPRLCLKNMAAVSYCEDNRMRFRVVQEKDLEREDVQTLLSIEGPDNCGKSHIGRALSFATKIPYFRPPDQHDRWSSGSFIDALRTFDPLMFEFIKQTKYDVIFDRNYASERCYSRVFKRETDDAVLNRLDAQYAKLGLIFVIALRRNFNGSGGDVIIPDDKLVSLREEYLRFVEWTKCRCIVIYVDDFENDVSQQISVLLPAIDEVRFSVKKKVLVLERGL